MPDVFLSNFPLYTQTSTRISLACIQCRSSHLRCDAATPVCSRCSANGKECVYQKSRRGGRRLRKTVSSHDNNRSSGGSACQQSHVQTLAMSHRRRDLTDSSGSTANSLDRSPGVSNLSSAASAHTMDLNSISIERGSSDAQEVALLLGEAPESQVVEEMLDFYYKFFHAAHPCALPRSFLQRRLEENPLGLKPVQLVMQYIGSLYTSSSSSASYEALVLEALATDRHEAGQPAAFQVQALLLYCIAVYWCDDIDRALKLLDRAISEAVRIGMNLQQFATKNGSGDPVVEESLRRTWWLVYTIDAHVAGSTHTYPYRTNEVPMSVDLPCEETQYESGVCLCLHTLGFVDTDSRSRTFHVRGRCLSTICENLRNPMVWSSHPLPNWWAWYEASILYSQTGVKQIQSLYLLLSQTSTQSS